MAGSDHSAFIILEGDPVNNGGSLHKVNSKYTKQKLRDEGVDREGVANFDFRSKKNSTQGRIQGRGPRHTAEKGPTFWPNMLAIYVKIPHFGREMC